VKFYCLYEFAKSKVCLYEDFWGRGGERLSVEAKMFVANSPPQQLFRFFSQASSCSGLTQFRVLNTHVQIDIHRHCHSKAWALCKSLSCKREGWKKEVDKSFHPL
jgi:hypothetical protein